MSCAFPKEYLSSYDGLCKDIPMILVMKAWFSKICKEEGRGGAATSQYLENLLNLSEAVNWCSDCEPIEAKSACEYIRKTMEQLRPALDAVSQTSVEDVLNSLERYGVSADDLKRLQTVRGFEMHKLVGNMLGNLNYAIAEEARSKGEAPKHLVSATLAHALSVIFSAGTMYVTLEEQNPTPRDWMLGAGEF